MLVFWKERLVFLATPKTGTTAIEAALQPLANLSIQNPPALKHTPVRRYQRFLAPYLRSAAGEDFTVVALMREPIDWLGSWYRYRQRDAIPIKERSTRGMDFDSFVTAHLANPCPGFADVGSQARFLDPGNGPGIDRVFRYENIGAFIEFLEDRLDFEIILPRLNVSPEGSTQLAPETEARLRRERAADFALYATLD
ncbi:hypothetical protein [Albidovulum sp.]|uniref:hypothetical protein n=1 Tax=Albidovulum sp. TaxID=1872424 RepID=UPI001D2821F7|nr:hypothetical protein [Paracoccaceae bacterium]MCC0046347.1 hypothetical protein [Defluviimonas sp.]HPE26636.1 hypothetical protein [Albidovulum sp.]MCB2121856.1 hypothetical protein [Paracoccaceae bacterium]MCB2138844.1 hypothetical protein [Paracoccaceae bacterium]